jgi:hypothetical protein
VHCSNLFPHLQAFRLVESGRFCGLLKFCHPSLSEKDIPHRRLFCDEIIHRALVAEGRVRETMGRVPSKISFTFNAWTSVPGDPYFSLTGHYIDAPADCPSAWTLKSEQLIFQEIQGRHTGKIMANILSSALERYGLCSKVGWFTSDGAAVNHTTLCALQKTSSVQTGWAVDEHNML